MRILPKLLILATLSFVSVSITACDQAGDTGNNGANMHEKIISELPADYVQGQETLKVAQAFLEAAGSGDATTLMTVMADDFVWHNEGDSSVPWIGNWEGKEEVMGTFMPKFGAGLKVTSWSTDYSFASGDQAVFVGTMSAIANNTGVDTGKFSWAVRVNVENGKVKSWNWFEDSFAVSQAYNGKNL